MLKALLCQSIVNQVLDLRWIKKAVANTSMAFSMKMGKLSMDNTPIYQVDTEKGVMGQALNNGSILIDKHLRGKDKEEVIKHEKVHLDQMSRGDLDYDDKNVYWKGKKYSRSVMNEGAKNLPWEKEAYNKTKKWKKS